MSGNTVPRGIMRTINIEIFNLISMNRCYCYIGRNVGNANANRGNLTYLQH